VKLEEPTTRDGGASPVAFTGYADEERPLAAYGALSSAFGVALTASLVALARSGRLPERLETRDLLLAGVATHKLSRLIAKDKVTSFLRAPFTRYQKDSGQGEVEEEPRGEGLQRALGELLSCPYCLAQWVGAAFICGLVASPKPTRLVAGVYVAETISDFLQAAYRAAEQSR
jgi:hypothetical protein